MTLTMKTGRTTIKDVAQRAGVSPIVVSRVCHPKPKEYVADSTRQKVLDAIAELNYVPDSRARYLRSGRTDTIGFYAGRGALTIEDEFGRALFDGLQAACGELNQDLMVFHPLDSRPAAAAQAIANSKVDGVVHTPVLDDDELAIALRNSHKPIVRVGEPFSKIPSVLAEDYDGAYRLARYLYARGHRRIMFRKTPRNLVSATRRYEGFCESSKRLNMEVVTMESYRQYDEITDEEAAALLNFRSEGITAVACWRDWSAAPVIDFCTRNGINVPEDLAVVGFDGLSPRTSRPDLRITTIVIDWPRIAELAVAKLIDLIEGREVAEETFLGCSLFVGNTA
jgi:LacI family transcriptional regulator